MANNILVLDAVGGTQTVKTTDTAGTHVPHYNVDNTVTVDLGANNDVQGAVAETTAIGSANNPFLIAGDDGTVVRHIAVATDGAVHVDDGGNTLTVDGTVSSLNLPTTSGGCSIMRSLDIDESEEAVKASAGQLYWVHAMNMTASVLYLKFYNATVASVVVGTTTPVLTFPILTQGDTNGAGFYISFPNGVEFGTAITVACTTGLADNDAGAPAANACVINVGYK